MGVPAASAGPHIILKSASPGRVPGSRRPLQAQHGTSSGPLWGQAYLLFTCKSQASTSLVTASPDPALPLSPGCVDRPTPSFATSNLFGLSFCPATGSLCRPKAYSTLRFVGPPSASRWPAQTQLRLKSSLCGTRASLPGASPDLALRSQQFPGARFLTACLPAAPTGLAPPTPWPVSAQLMPLVACPELWATASHWPF